MVLINLEAVRSAVAQADAVSFDVFDTLLVRALAQPADVFEYMVPRDAKAFRTARIAGEIVARSNVSARSQNSEVTLIEIYREIDLHRFSGASDQDEMAAELRVIRPRPLGVRLLEMAKDAGKPVFGVSDTYLTSAQLQRLLNECGIAVDRVFTSSESGGGKYDGKLFERLLTQAGLRPERVLHIGDNRDSDFHGALRAGIRAFHLPSVIELMFRDASYNLVALEELRDSGSLLGSFVLAHVARVREADQPQSAVSRYAHMYGGPLVYCFCSWLAQRCREDGIRKLLVMARDGLIIRDALAVLVPELNVEILQLSRRALLVPHVLESAEAFEGIFPPDGVTPLGEIICSVFPEAANDLGNALGVAGFDLKQPISLPHEAVRVRETLRANRALIDDQLSKEQAGVERYLSTKGLGQDGVAVADCGWALSSHRALDRIVGTPVRGYYLGVNDRAYLTAKIRFMLPSNNPRSEWHRLVHSAVELLELAFLSNEDQVERILATETGYRVDKRVPSVWELSRRIVADELHRGIMAFCQDAKRLGVCSDREEDLQILTFLFRNLALNPTRGERSTLGEILHDRYAHNGRYFNLGAFWFDRPSAAAPGRPSLRSIGRLALRFIGLWRLVGPGIALRRARAYIRRALTF